jgi:hypothetical protein
MKKNRQTMPTLNCDWKRSGGEPPFAGPLSPSEGYAGVELYSVRDGINIARYALKMMAATDRESQELLPLAVERILGEEALRYLK